MIINSANDPENVYDKHFTLVCPHCLKPTGLSAISIPRYEYLKRFEPECIGIVYKCDACSKPVFLRFRIRKLDFGNSRVLIEEDFEIVEHPIETYEYEYLPETVESDFREALTCYSCQCHNAFAAMCRRTIQALSTEIGAEGKSKVEKQINELRDMGVIDEGVFEQLRVVMVGGHDGVHPSLPIVSAERAAILLQIMRDVLYEVFVRKAKLEEANQLRTATIDDKKEKQGEQ